MRKQNHENGETIEEELEVTDFQSAGSPIESISASNEVVDRKLRMLSIDLNDNSATSKGGLPISIA